MEVVAGPEHEGQRLDRFLAAAVPQLSRSRLQDLVREGRVREGVRVIAEPAQRVKGGDRFTVEVPPALPAAPEPEGRELDILFEDEHLVVLEKPAGVVVHPAPGHSGGTLVNALLAHCAGSLSGIGGVARPGIVHRIDKEVSGVLVVAKNDRAHIGLAGQFAVHSVDRVYEAIVWGVPAASSGTVDAPIGRHPVDRKRMAVVERGGKRAVTHWRRIGAAGTVAARMEVRLETGRTHQIRVHLSRLGHPIVGDRLYADRKARPTSPAGRNAVAQLDRILLHARRLGFIHPVTGESLAFERPAPPVFDRVLAVLGT